MADDTITLPAFSSAAQGSAGTDSAEIDSAGADSASPYSPELEAANKAYQAMFDALGEAYWAATTIEGKDQIQAARDNVHTILTAILQAQFQEDTTQLDKLNDLIITTNDALDKLQTSINSIVKTITVVTKVEDAITGVLQLAGKFL